jgi:hypothetical protein
VSIVVANAAWMTVGEMVYVNAAGASGGAGVLQVTAIAANTITLLNPAPPTAGSMDLSPLIWGETPSGNTNGLNRTFTSAYPYNSNFLGVFLNGVRQRLTNDYTQTGAQSFQFLNAPSPGDTVSIDYAQQ